MNDSINEMIAKLLGSKINSLSNLQGIELGSAKEEIKFIKELTELNKNIPGYIDSIQCINCPVNKENLQWNIFLKDGRQFEYDTKQQETTGSTKALVF